MVGYDLALVTCTADQPIGMALCERFMQAQTAWGKMRIQWVVADDGDVPAVCTLGQVHIRRRREPDCSPSRSLCRNLKAALREVYAPLIAIIEHDDYYGPSHLEEIVAALTSRHNALACGQMSRYYYNVERRCYRLVRDGAPALCQMALRAEAIPLLRKAAADMDSNNWRGVDLAFWRSVDANRRVELSQGSVVGIKGLPGRAGIGYGHRPTSRGWTPDPVGAKLAELVGAELAREYLSLHNAPPFKLHGYRNHAEYVREQVRGNARKIGRTWANERSMIDLAGHIKRLVGQPRFGVCHGTRNGAEQRWLAEVLPGCTVVGTEISPSAAGFPNTVQWDFHEPYEAWLGRADFVYSNSLDHARDPERALRTWMATLRPGGVCVIEHSADHGPAHVTATDPFGVEPALLPRLIDHWGNGQFLVKEVLPAPMAKGKDSVFVVVVAGHRSAEIER